MSEAHQHARELGAIGWRVLPIKPGQKRPPMAAWQNSATDNPRTIDNWYTGLYSDHGVGIATGPQPNGQNLVVIDLDEHDPAKSGRATIELLRRRYGDLPSTVEAATGSGGVHLYFLAPPDLEVRNDAGSRLGPGIDIRGTGGQVLAPPTVHPNGTPYRWTVSPLEHEVAPMPGWMIELIANPQAQQPTTPLSNDGDGPAARYNATHTWEQLLTGDGWQYSHSDTSGEQHWTRPGKDSRHGTSATVGYKGQDVLVVFTSSVDGLPAGAYSKFGYYACTQHAGDRSAAAREIRRTEQTIDRPSLDDLIAKPADEIGGSDSRLLDMLVDWPSFWEQDHTIADWLAEPLIASARAHAIFAPGGTGKSLLALWLSAAIATGTPILGHAQPAHRVLYLDFEMTADDLAERLESMGYGPEHDLSKLRYALLPDLESLDSKIGGTQVARLAELVDADLVVIDTFGRAVAGDENEADTVRAFYRHCGIMLKKAGRAFVRIDHAGKDLERGQRGSSAKNDDVDVVWQMTRTGAELYTMKTRKRRMGWVPEKLDLRMTDDPLTFTLAHAAPLPDGAAALVATLDEMGLAADLSSRATRAALTDAGVQASNAVLRAAVKERQRRHAGLSDEAALESYLL